MKSEKITGIFDLFLIILAAVLFSPVHLYISIAIVVLHCFALLQLNRTKNLLGYKPASPSNKKRIQVGLLLFCIAYGAAKQLIKNEVNLVFVPEEMSTAKLAALFNGQELPFVVILCLLVAAMMVGLTTEKKRR